MDPYSLITRLLPRKARKNFNQMVMYSTIKVSSDKLLGFMILAGIALGYTLAEFVKFAGIPPAVIGVAAFVGVEAVFYLWVSFSIDSKSRFVESILPDALQLMSSNIRAGLTTDRALLMAARPEFGPFAEEIRRVGKETMTGASFVGSLLKINQRIKSEPLSKTLDLIVSSMKSGGKLADLLDQTSGDLRDQQIINKEISASVLLYVIFIAIAIALAEPLLFAMSCFLVNVLITMSSKIARDMPSDMQGSPIKMSDTDIDPAFLQDYSIVALIISALLGSMVMGLILKGSSKDGFKYVPFMMIVALGLFFLGSYVMDAVLGSMIKI